MSNVSPCDPRFTSLRADLFRFAALIIVASLIVARPAVAANIWDGGDLDDNLWSKGDNWDNNVVPTFPVALTFGGTVRPVSTNDLPNLTINGFTFNVGSGPFTINGNSFTLNGPIVNNSTSAVPQTINNNITLAAPTSINTAGALTLGGKIDGGFAISIDTGTGLSTLTGSNSYTGGTTINAGTLNVGSAGRWERPAQSLSELRLAPFSTAMPTKSIIPRVCQPLRVKFTA